MASVRKLKSGNYQVRWREDGVHHTLTCSDKKTANDLRSEIEKARALNRPFYNVPPLEEIFAPQVPKDNLHWVAVGLGLVPTEDFDFEKEWYSIGEVAEFFERSPSTIRRWTVERKIKLRGRGQLCYHREDFIRLVMLQHCLEGLTTRQNALVALAARKIAPDG